MTTFFGAIADDLTGATDLAALLSRSGVRVSLRMGVPQDPPSDTAPFEIIALKCRTVPPDEAVAESRKALGWLQDAGAQRFFWKYCSTFDSTSQGNIGPVSEALMTSLGVEQTIYCPAFPENGRAVFMGNLFVGEQLLAESPMKDHPLTPMRDSNLVRFLQHQVSAPVGLADRHVVAAGPKALRKRLLDLRADGFAHVVVDAVANDDLYDIANACRDMVLITGGSAIAMPLPEIWVQQGLVERTDLLARKRAGTEPAVVLSGSCSAMTNRQVQAYLSAGHPSFMLDPLALAREGAEAAVNWLSGQHQDAVPMIYATASPDSVRAAQEQLGADCAGRLVEEALAICAVTARNLGRRRFVVAGGETSGAVAYALGIRRLDVGAEIDPGVPWCSARMGDEDVAITLKSGNFGSADFFTRALGVMAA